MPDSSASDAHAESCLSGACALKTGRRVRAYVELQLVPVLKLGDVVVMEKYRQPKISNHPSVDQSANARLWFLPHIRQTSISLNRLSSKIKQWMGNARKSTIGYTWRHIGRSKASSPRNSKNYLENPGYASAKDGTL